MILSKRESTKGRRALGAKTAMAWVLGLGLLVAGALPTWAGSLTANQFIYKPSLGARGTTEKNAFDAGLDKIDARLGKEVWVGDPKYGTTLQEAITAIGSNNAILRIPSGSFAITGSLTVPANICLHFERGASLSISNGVTVTVNGVIEGGPWQIFSGQGTVNLTGANLAGGALFNWWGAVGDGATNNKTAFAQAVASGAKYLALIGPGTYLTDDQMVFTGDSRQVVGVGLPVIQHTGTFAAGYDLFQFQGTGTLVDGIKFTSSYVGSNKWFIRLGTSGAGGQVGGTVRNCVFDATGFGGVVQEGQSAGFANDTIIIENNRILQLGDHAIYLAFPPAAIVKNNYIAGVSAAAGKFAIQYYRGRALTNNSVNPVIIEGNTILDNCIICSNENPATMQVADVIIKGNLIANNTGAVLALPAIRLGYRAINILVEGNNIVNNGIQINGSSTVSYNKNIKIIGNSIINGYINPYLTTNYLIASNDVRNYAPGGGQVASMIHSAGYNLNLTILSNNLGNDDTVNYNERAISLTPSLDSGVIIQGNNIGNFKPVAAGRTWYVPHGYISGLIMKGNTSVESQSIASANPLTIPAFGELITVTGTNNFSSINHADYQTYPGRIVTLIFTGVLTVTDGANLVLNGNLTTAAGTTLTLCFKDTTDTGVWYEVSRSVN